jgi:hypothetical protein
MLVRRRYALALFVASVGAVAYLGVSLSQGVTPTPAAVSAWRRVRPADSVRVADALAKLPLPAGFQRSNSCGVIPVGGICLNRRRSVVVDRSSLAKVLAGFGSRLDPPPFFCAALRHHRTPRLEVAACSAEATRGAFLLNFSLTSVVEETATSTRSATEPYGTLRGGTTVAVFVEDIRR